jgi:hypothetical protein
MAAAQSPQSLAAGPVRKERWKVRGMTHKIPLAALGGAKETGRKERIKPSGRHSSAEPKFGRRTLGPLVIWPCARHSTNLFFQPARPCLSPAEPPSLPAGAGDSRFASFGPYGPWRLRLRPRRSFAPAFGCLRPSGRLRLPLACAEVAYGPSPCRSVALHFGDFVPSFRFRT